MDEPDRCVRRFPPDALVSMDTSDSSDSCSSSESEKNRSSKRWRRASWRRSLDLPTLRRRWSRSRSCQSLKSDWSKLDPPTSSQELLTRWRAVSGGPSCESLKSSWSKDINFTHKPALLRAVSSGSIAVSLKSNWSKRRPLNFSQEPLTRWRAVSGGPSCESLKSSWSKDIFINFTNKPALLRAGSSGSSDVSLKSDVSKLEPPMFSEEPLARSNKSKSLKSLKSDCPEEQVMFFRLMSCCLSDWSNIREEHQRHLLARCESVREGLEQIGVRAQLHSVYSELFITETRGGRTELQRLETQFMKKNFPEPALKLHDLFTPKEETPPPARQAPPPLRLVLTLGVAGVGKTFSVLKFCLDWAQGSENQRLQLVVPLSFREMNLLSTRRRYSLIELIHMFHPALRTLPPHALSFCKLLLIFDGLDESRLPLDFSCEVISEVTQSSEVRVLLVNLLRGDLLPHALIWITSRPAAANQLPARCVHRVTEVRGFFTERQKEMFFSRRFSDPQQLHCVLSHLRSSCSVSVMAQIPVFCWIFSTVLEHELKSGQSGPLPQTLTELYVLFLLVQTQRKRKYEGLRGESSELTSGESELLLKLGRLALLQLLRGNISFYREDLEEVGLDLTEASVQSGLCSEVFMRESVIFQRSVYSFIHLSVQEFMAALYLHVCFSRGHSEELREFLGDWDGRASLHVLLHKALEKSFQSPSGHLDLFVRFLHGLCVPTTRRLLGALLPPTDYGSSVDKVIYKLKFMNTEVLPPDRSVNIYHCLSEMKDQTFLQELQELLGDSDLLCSWDGSRRLSGIVCSALGDRLQMSEQVLEELDLRKFNTNNEGRRRLLPAVRNCTRGILGDLQLDSAHFAVVCSALSSSPSHLRVLDLSQNRVLDSDLEDLCEALQSPDCGLETLSLRGCGLTDITPLLAALRSRPSLREVDLRENRLLKHDVQELKELQQSAPYRLEVRFLSGGTGLTQHCSLHRPK